MLNYVNNNVKNIKAKNDKKFKKKTEKCKIQISCSDSLDDKCIN